MMRLFPALLIVLLLLAGCSGASDPYRVDTVVRIPADPDPVEPVQTLPEPETFPPLVFPELEGVPEFTLPSGVQVQESQKPASTQKKEETGKRENRPAGGTATEAPPAQVSEPAAPEVRETDILAAVNDLRAAEGLPALAWDADLAQMAGVRCKELAQLWGHTRPDGRSYTTVAEGTVWEGCLASELAGYTFGGESWSAVISDWAGSASHRAALLDRSCTAAGIGLYRSGDEIRICLLLGKR